MTSIPSEDFVMCKWEDLPGMSYAAMSYQWRSFWHHFILLSSERVQEECIWLDVFCINQLDPGKMKTVLRADEIYYHAKAYHLMEIGSLGRGWVQFELCSISETNLPPKIHFTTRDPAIIDTAKKTLKKFGFDASEFTVEDDRAIVNHEDEDHPQPLQRGEFQSHYR